MRRGLTIADIDWFVPHQANQRILDGTASKLGIPGKVISTVAVHGNTSAASCPWPRKAVRDGRIKKGDLVLWKLWVEGLPGAPPFSGGGGGSFAPWVCRAHPR